MHDDAIAIDADLARRLVAGQFPRWAGLEVTPVPSTGTDHALYRLGDALLLRMPRISWAQDQPDSDRRWLSLLAPHLPLTVPVPVATGEPTLGYPSRWSVVPWMPGQNPDGTNHDAVMAARDLAAFVRALHRIDTVPAAPTSSRGGPLIDRTGSPAPRSPSSAPGWTPRG